MLISELSFDHLRAEHEARLTRELERRRIVEERRAEVTSEPVPGRRRVRWSTALRMLRTPAPTRTPRPSARPADPCPTCPSPA